MSSRGHVQRHHAPICRSRRSLRVLDRARRDVTRQVRHRPEPGRLSPASSNVRANRAPLSGGGGTSGCQSRPRRHQVAGALLRWAEKANTHTHKQYLSISLSLCIYTHTHTVEREREKIHSWYGLTVLQKEVEVEMVCMTAHLSIKDYLAISKQRMS